MTYKTEDLLWISISFMMTFILGMLVGSGIEANDGKSINELKLEYQYKIDSLKIVNTK